MEVKTSSMSKRSKKVVKLVLVSFIFSVLSTNFLVRPQFAWTVANLRNAKDVLSDSRPSNTTTKHDFYFRATTAIPLSGKIVIDLPSAFDLGVTHTFADMDLIYSANVDLSSPTTCTLAATAAAGVVGVAVDTTLETITFTMAPSGACNGIAADQYIQATLGDGAAGGDDEVANPAKVAATGTADTYVIAYETQNASSATLDTATVRVAIIDAVTILAEVQATLSCTVAGVASGANFNTQGNTYGTAGFATLANEINFGILNTAASQSGQLIKVSTNGATGFYFAVKQTGNLTSSDGDDIDVFDDGTLTDNTAPAAWSVPAGTAGSEATYGHLGYGATDLTLDDLNGAGAASRFTGAKFAGLSTTYEAVLSHDGPADGVNSDTNGQGDIVYQVQLSGLQETGRYSNTVVYLCTGRY